MSGHFNWDHKDKDKEQMIREFMKMMAGKKETGKDSTDMVQNYLPSPEEFMDAMTLQKHITNEDSPDKAIIKRIIISTIYKTTADLAKKVIEEKQPLETIITAMPELDGFGSCVIINSDVDPEMSEFVKSAFIVMKQQTGSMLLSVLHGKNSEKSRAIIEAELKKIQDYLDNPKKESNIFRKTVPVGTTEIDIDNTASDDELTAEEARALAKKILKDMGF